MILPFLQNGIPSTKKICIGSMTKTNNEKIINAYIDREKIRTPRLKITQNKCTDTDMKEDKRS